MNQEYKIFYIGTNSGHIYKIVQFIQNGEPKSTLLDIFEVAQNEAIQVMQISQKRKSLYVSTDHRIKQIDLAMCSRRYDSCFRCVKDPYCGWDESTSFCKPYELGLLQVSLIRDKSLTLKAIPIENGALIRKYFCLTFGPLSILCASTMQQKLRMFQNLIKCFFINRSVRADSKH